MRRRREFRELNPSGPISWWALSHSELGHQGQAESFEELAELGKSDTESTLPWSTRFMELTIETKLTLNDGHLIPQLGLGVWQIRAGAVCEPAVLAALEAGYRHIDTASMYGNAP